MYWDPGPCSAPKCGKFDPSNIYVHFCQKALDQPKFTDYNNEMYRIQMYMYMANENDMDGITPGKCCKDK
jgi:hypothetical protein